MCIRDRYDLQLIDSRIDKIRSVRGELPLEVEDLEDEIEGLDFRINKINEELSELELGIKEKQNMIEESKAMITKYNDQQKNVRNNRAFESLRKEIEFQELEIQYSEKQINELKAEIEEKKEKPFNEPPMKNVKYLGVLFNIHKDSFDFSCICVSYCKFQTTFVANNFPSTWNLA